MVQSITEIFQGEVSPYGKKVLEQGRVHDRSEHHDRRTGLNTMIVADEQRLDEIADPVIREAVRKQLEVKLPVHPDKVLIKMECVGVCGSDVHYFHEGQCGTFFLDPGRDIPYMLGHEAAGTRT